MMDLNEVRIFVKVAQLGSFSAAARTLGLPNSTVSHKVSALERRLGLTLIQRTTRKLRLTPAGELYFARSVRGLNELEAAESEVTAGTGEVRGTLRVTAPVNIGNSVFPALLQEFLKMHPGVTVDVILSDERFDLVREGIDLALRAGVLSDSSLIARRIGEESFGVFASPRYLREHGIPRRPADLSRHRTLQFSRLGGGPWHLEGASGTVDVAVESRLASSDLNFIRMMAIEGVGLALLPSSFCAEDVDRKRLTRILPSWSTAKTPIQFVYPAQPFVPPRLTAFLNLGVERLRPLFKP